MSDLPRQVNRVDVRPNSPIANVYFRRVNENSETVKDIIFKDVRFYEPKTFVLCDGKEVETIADFVAWFQGTASTVYTIVRVDDFEDGEDGKPLKKIALSRFP